MLNDRFGARVLPTLFLLILSVCSALAGGREVTQNGVTYWIDYDSKEATLLNASTQMSGTFTVPSKLSIDGVDYVMVAIGTADNSASGIRGLQGQKYLSSVILPESIRILGHHAFSNCTNLAYVNMPSKLEYICTRCFNNVQRITELKVPKNVKYIGDYAFAWMSALKTLEIRGACDEYLSYNMFGANEGFEPQVETLYLGGNLTAVPDWMLPGCNSLKNLTIEGCVEIIGESAFEGCINIKALTISGKVNRIKTSAFKGCAQIGTLVFDCPLYKIEANAFAGLSQVKKIDFPETLREIGASAFEYCSGIESVNIRTGISLLGGKAFYHCTSLKGKIVVPYSVTTIGASVFEGCEQLESIEVNSVSGSIGSGFAKDCSSLKSVKINGGVTNIMTSAFQNCPVLSEVVINAPITQIRSNAFYQCAALTEIGLPVSLTTIDSGVFRETGLTNPVIPASVTKMGSICLPSTMTTLTVLRSVPISLTSDITENYEDCELIVHAGSKDVYSTANIWKKFNKVSQVSTPQSVTIPGTLSLNVGRTRRLQPVYDPVDSYGAYTWQSLNTSIATVDDAGLVKGVAKGSTTVKLMNGAATVASCVVTVKDKLPDAAEYIIKVDNQEYAANQLKNESLTVYKSADFIDDYQRYEPGVTHPYPIGKATFERIVHLTTGAKISIVSGENDEYRFGSRESGVECESNFDCFALTGENEIVWSGPETMVTISFVAYSYAEEDIESGANPLIPYYFTLVAEDGPVEDEDVFTVYMKRVGMAAAKVWIWDASGKNPWNVQWGSRPEMKQKIDANGEPYFIYTFSKKAGEYLPTNIIFSTSNDGFANEKSTKDLEFVNNRLYILDNNSTYNVTNVIDDWEPGKPADQIDPKDKPVTIYLHNDGGWAQTGYDMYVYIYGDENASWPGEKMIYDNTLRIGNKLGFYKYEVPRDCRDGSAMFTLSKVTNGNSQTADRFPGNNASGLGINCDNHIYYTSAGSTDGWLLETPGEAFSGNVPAITIKAVSTVGTSPVSATLSVAHTDADSKVESVNVKISEYQFKDSDKWNKKAYRVKADSNLQVAENMNPHSEWMLMPWNSDTELGYLRNITGHELSRLLEMDWTPSELPVELVVNGDYLGLYFLVESIAPGETRVNVDHFSQFETAPGSLHNHIVRIDGESVVADNTVSAQYKIAATQPVTVYFTSEAHDYSASGDFAAQVQREAYKADFSRDITELNAAMCEMGSTPKGSSWNTVIDAESLAKYFILNELMDDPGAFRRNMYAYRNVTKCDGTNDDVRWKFGPVWDFSESFSSKGEKTGFLCDKDAQSIFESSMLQNYVFKTEVSRLWKQFTLPQKDESDESDKSDELDVDEPSAQELDDAGLMPDTRLAQVRTRLENMADKIDVARYVDLLRWPSGYAKQTANMPMKSAPASSSESVDTIIDYLRGAKVGMDNLVYDQIFTGVESPVYEMNENGIPEYYDILGRRITRPQPGSVTIIRTPNGSTQKVIK